MNEPAPQPERPTALDLSQTMTKGEYDAWVAKHNTTPTLQEPVYNHSAGSPDRREVQPTAGIKYGPTYGPGEVVPKDKSGF